jgi:acetyl-CoA carboxylase alpha subunit
MFEMAKLKVPIITIVIGEGSSGGALAISIANKNNFKIIDKIIEEKEKFEIVAKNMSQEILKLVNELNTMSKTEIIQQRYLKFRQIGDYKERN